MSWNLYMYGMVCGNLNMFGFANWVCLACVLWIDEILKLYVIR